MLSYVDPSSNMRTAEHMAQIVANQSTSTPCSYSRSVRHVLRSAWLRFRIAWLYEREVYKGLRRRPQARYNSYLSNSLF